jgi:hypothetical protein
MYSACNDCGFYLKGCNIIGIIEIPIICATRSGRTIKWFAFSEKKLINWHVTREILPTFLQPQQTEMIQINQGAWVVGIHC